MDKHPLDTLIVGVDVDNRTELLHTLDQLALAKVRHLKIGPVMMLNMGLPALDRVMKDRGFGSWFMDAKFSNTDGILTATADKACNLADFTMLNCMADVGPGALKQFADRCRNHNVLSLAVTYLTTKDDNVAMAQHDRTALEQVMFYAHEWVEPAKLDGIVCSAREAQALRKSLYAGLLVCPGIRFAGSNKGDQKRVMTPTRAIENGADYLVMATDILKGPINQVARYVDEVGAVMQTKA